MNFLVNGIRLKNSQCTIISDLADRKPFLEILIDFHHYDRLAHLDDLTRLKVFFLDFSLVYEGVVGERKMPEDRHSRIV